MKRDVTIYFSGNRWMAMVLTMLAATICTVSQAEPLRSAKVTEIKNEVRIAKDGAEARRAVQQDTVEGKDRLSTGKKSRAELEFPDKSIARLGANTIFSFDPQSRDMKVDQGTALIHVPPGLDGARISAPAATAAIQGDVVAMRVDDKGMTQIVALSQDARGPIQVTLNKTGETQVLHAGEMLTIDPTVMKMPAPLTVAVDVMVQSSGLASGFKKELPPTATKEIKQTLVFQEKEIKRGGLEHPGKWVTAKNDAQQGLLGNSTANQVIVQSTTANNFAGHYTGTTTDTFGSQIGATGSITIDIRGDGSVTIRGPQDTGTGSINGSGNFTVNVSSSTESFVVTGRVGSGAISGTYVGPNKTPPPPTTGGVFRASK